MRKVSARIRSGQEFLETLYQYADSNSNVVMEMRASIECWEIQGAKSNSSWGKQSGGVMNTIAPCAVGVSVTRKGNLSMI